MIDIQDLTLPQLLSIAIALLLLVLYVVLVIHKSRVLGILIYIKMFIQRQKQPQRRSELTTANNRRDEEDTTTHPGEGQQATDILHSERIRTTECSCVIAINFPLPAEVTYLIDVTGVAHEITERSNRYIQGGDAETILQTRTGPEVLARAHHTYPGEFTRTLARHEYTLESITGPEQTLHNIPGANNMSRIGIPGIITTIGTRDVTRDTINDISQPESTIADTIADLQKQINELKATRLDIKTLKIEKGDILIVKHGGDDRHMDMDIRQITEQVGTDMPIIHVKNDYPISFEKISANIIKKTIKYYKEESEIINDMKENWDEFASNGRLSNAIRKMEVK